MAEAAGQTFRILPGFAVPFAEVMLPNCEKLNSDLRALFLARERDGDTYRDPTPTMDIEAELFQSRFDLFYWTDPPVVALREFCTHALYKVIAELNGYGQQQINELRMQVDAWFHITRAGGWFGTHNHPMASWSGVYCVDSGYGTGEPQTGELIFSHPAPAASMFMDLAVGNLRDPWSTRSKTYRLRPGNLVLFPSWVMHHVQPFKGPHERITVAFNCWFNKVAAPKAE